MCLVCTVLMPCVSYSKCLMFCVKHFEVAVLLKCALRNKLALLSCHRVGDMQKYKLILLLLLHSDSEYCKKTNWKIYTGM